MQSLSITLFLEPAGDLTSESVRRVCDALRSTVATRRLAMISLGSVERFSWAGLQQLARGLRAESARGWTITLCDVPVRVRGLLDVCGIAHLIEPAVDVTAA